MNVEKIASTSVYLQTESWEKQIAVSYNTVLTQRWDWKRGGKREGEDICMIMADLCRCRAELTQHCSCAFFAITKIAYKMVYLGLEIICRKL